MLNTLRKWPYFKFYPNDWLTSNTILLMTSPQIGSYITLLCRAWTEEDCTLPMDPAALKILSKWDGTDEDFLPVLACFPLLKNQKRRHNPRLYKERQEAVHYREKQSAGGKKGMEARWAEKPTRNVKPKQPKPVTATDWLATLQALPIYAHVNWPHEMGKIHEWHSRPENVHRIINQRFVATWVNKIQAPLSNGHAVSLTCPLHPTMTFPALKDKQHHDRLYHPKFEG